MIVLIADFSFQSNISSERYIKEVSTEVKSEKLALL